MLPGVRAARARAAPAAAYWAQSRREVLSWPREAMRDSAHASTLHSACGAHRGRHGNCARTPSALASHRIHKPTPLARKAIFAITVFCAQSFARRADPASTPAERMLTPGLPVSVRLSFSPSMSSRSRCRPTPTPSRAVALSSSSPRRVSPRSTAAGAGPWPVTLLAHSLYVPRAGAPKVSRAVIEYVEHR